MKLDLVTGSAIVQRETKKDIKPVDPTPFMAAFSCAAFVGITATFAYFYATSDYHNGHAPQPTAHANAPTIE